MKLSTPEKVDDITISAITDLQPFCFQTLDQYTQIYESIKEQVIDYFLSNPDFFNGKTFSREHFIGKYTQPVDAVTLPDADYKIATFGSVKFQNASWWIEPSTIQGVTRIEPIAPEVVPVDDSFF